jgi:hypothetical protein
LTVAVDAEVVEIVSGISSNPLSDVHLMLFTCPIEKSTTEWITQWDDQIDHNPGVPPFLSTVFSIQWSKGESEVEHIGCDDVGQENSMATLDDMTQTDVTTEEMHLESREPDISSSVNISYLCARTVAFGCSILASAVGKQCPNRRLISSLHRIRVMMAKFLILDQISKGGATTSLFNCRMPLAGVSKTNVVCVISFQLFKCFIICRISEQY